jgi:HK97 family phage major capsid protein
MIIEFTDAIGDLYAKGQIIEVPDDKARTVLALGQAKESDAASLLRATNKADMDKFRADLLGEIRSALKPASNRTPAPPTGGGGVDFNDRIDPGAPAGKRSWGEMMKAVFCAQAMGAPPEMRDWGRNILHKEYTDGQVTYRVTDNGELEERVERDGVSIVRTGTESISGGPTYGFSVKPDWATSLFRIPIEASVIEGAAFEVPTAASLEFKWPALDQFKTPVAGQSAAYGGFQLSRKGEITQRQYTDAALSMIEFKITDLTAFTTLSRDLVADNYLAIDAIIQQVLAQAFQWKKDFEFINGNGIGSPTGFLNGNALLTQTRGTSAHVEYEDIVGMLAKLHPALWRESRWLAHISTLVDLVAIHNHAAALVYQPNALIAQSDRPSIMGTHSVEGDMNFRAAGTLLGLPVYFTEKLPKPGTTGYFNLVHPKSYGVATRAGLEVGLSEHFLFDTDTIAYRFKLRNDAKPLWRAPYTQSDGGTTGATQVSAFVALTG